jgi:two-component system sensor histidine kinase KdpD
MTNNGRPDPDQLLARVQEEEAKAARGKLKIFFGASAGVGKTYAMLGAARQQKGAGNGCGHRRRRDARPQGNRGPDRRSRTSTPVEIPYRGKVLKEFDLDAALARRPALILMDELAHSNVAGSRHPKRWQDVHELLAAGIDVYSTVNVQHLETLNDVVSGIAGIRVWETVPDRIFDEADEVVLVDLPPDELLQRLKEGKVYLPQQAERAIRNFFRKGNLIALRELALRRTADRVDDEMLAYRRETSVATVWQTRDALLVCIGSGTGAERLVRTGARLAGRLEAPWHAIHVDTHTSGPEPEVQRQRIVRALELSASLGAETATLSADDPVAAIVDYAREQNLSRVLVGRDHPRPWRPWYRSMADRIGHAAPDLDVVQVARNEDARAAVSPSTAAPAPGDWLAYLKAAAICAVATGLATPLAGVIELTNIAMLFLLAVLIVAMRLGRGPAVASSFLAVAAFDFFFVPPRFSFAVSDAQYLMTFAVMLSVALITGQLTARYKQHADVATVREARARALYEMARDLSAALLPMQIAEACDRFLSVEFGAQAAAPDRCQGSSAGGDGQRQRSQRQRTDRRRGRRTLGLRSRRGGRAVHRHLAGQPTALPAAQGADADARRARHRAARPAARAGTGSAPAARDLCQSGGDRRRAHALCRGGAVHAAADGIREPAQLAAGGDLARSANAAERAGGAGRVDQADAAAAN